MAWDFSTEPEFQEKLDWVEQFCREEIEPFSIVFPAAVRSKHPKMRAMVGASEITDDDIVVSSDGADKKQGTDDDVSVPKVSTDEES